MEGMGWRRMADALREVISEVEIMFCNSGEVSQKLPGMGSQTQSQSYKEALVQMMAPMQS